MFHKCFNILDVVLTSHIANQWKTKQIKSPLIGEFVKCAKAEPLHLKNNIVKEWFKDLLKICVSQLNLKQFKSFKENPKDFHFHEL